MIEVNGKIYPLWSQFVERKKEWIGGRLESFENGEWHKTVVADIQLLPNGKDSAMFIVGGKDFTCSFDVSVGGVMAGEEGWITFCGYGGHEWRIRQTEASNDRH